MRRTRRTLAALALAFTATMPVLEARAFVCTLPRDERALGTRLLQTELMVAALSCQTQSQYNAFVGKFRDELVPQGFALKAFFKRAYGSGAEQRLTSFVTALANERSAASLGQWPGYCAKTGDLFAQTLALKPGELTTFALAQPFSREHGFKACGVTASTSTPEPPGPIEKD